MKANLEGCIQTPGWLSCFGSEQVGCGTVWDISAQTPALDPYARYDDKIQLQQLLQIFKANESRNFQEHFCLVPWIHKRNAE